jgi:hypothetical protein
MTYYSRANTQYMPGTANTGWFGTGGTTTDTHRGSPSPSSGGSHTSTGKINILMFLMNSLFFIGFGGTTRR